MSKIKKISKEDLQYIVKTSKSYVEILRKIGVKPGNTTYVLKKRLHDENIEYNHIKNSSWNNGLTTVKEDDFKKHICNQEPEWNGKKMVLVFDHINGIRNDNRLSNLRFVCPNCNSQLPTTCRKGCEKRIEWKAATIVEKIRNGKSIRQCLLDEGLSDGYNYKKLKTICGTLVKMD